MPELPVKYLLNIRFIALAYCLLLITPVITAGCNFVPGDAYDPGKNEIILENRKDLEAMEQKDTYLKQSIPPLDKNLPKTLETATLAMG